jgi:hypothetical protein
MNFCFTASSRDIPLVISAKVLFRHSVILSLSKDQFGLPFFRDTELILRQAQDDGLFRKRVLRRSPLGLSSNTPYFELFTLLQSAVPLLIWGVVGYSMNFRDVPNLLKFEQYARQNAEDEIVMDCYKRIRELIAPVPKPSGILDFGGSAAPTENLLASCQAVEKSTRLLWACAAATDQISPRLWDYLPDYDSSISYFSELDDLELMAVTKLHRITWEEAASV